MAIASGTFGTCAWSISDSGALTLGGGILGATPFETAWPWDKYRDKITSASITGSISSQYESYSAGTTNTLDLNYMFKNCSNLASVNGLSNLKNAINTREMFYNCSSLTSLNLSGFNTSNVTDMSQMFSDCSSLTSLNLSGFNTSNVTDMRYMFFRCSSLTSLDLSSFNTSNVTSMQDMFNDCSSLTSLDLSSFNTSNVTNMFSMFDGCKVLTSITFGSNWDMSALSDSPGSYKLHIIDPTYTSSYRTARNTSSGLTITSDEQFYKLNTTDRVGTWKRIADKTDITCTAERTLSGVAAEDGDDITFSFSWVFSGGASSASVDIWQKEAGASSYPSTATYTTSLSGASGTSTYVVTGLTGAYDFRVEINDGTSTYVFFPSVSSVIRFVDFDPESLEAHFYGNVKVGPVEVVSNKGAIEVVSSNISSTSEKPSSNIWGTIVALFDKLGALRSYLRHVDAANGSQGVQVETVRSVNGSNVTNGLQLYITENGARGIAVSDSAAWRSALWLGTTAPGTILWSGAIYMTGGHTVNLSHNISTCPSGVLLHWQPYSNGAAQNWGHEFTFIPKTQHNGAGCMARLATSKFGVVGTKYFYVSDNKITGNNDNNASGTANGIKYNNGYWVLTQVIAV